MKNAKPGASDPVGTQMNSLAQITTAWARARSLEVETQFSVDSTNDWALENWRTCIYTAETQLSGRGQFGRKWSNGQAHGDQWIFSASRVTPTPPQPILSLVVGYLVCRSLMQIFAGETSNSIHLKVPNDLYLGEKKICGILCEATSIGPSHLIVFGIGLNVFSPPNLPAGGCLFPSPPTDLRLRVMTKWPDFLSEFWDQLSEVWPSNGRLELSESFQSGMLNSLNESSFHRNQFKSIEEAVSESHNRN